MKKVTYLFGAGASVGSLPLVNEIPEKINEFILFLKDEDMALSETLTYRDLKISITKRELQVKLISDLEWVYKQSAKHASIDTYAKKLSIISRNDELKKLKIALSVFFTYEQRKNKINPRYDTFFASLINTQKKFPENVRILSWNYDYQFELAYSEYSGNDNIILNQRELNVHSKMLHNDNVTGFGIFKLNGVAGLYSLGGRDKYTFVSELKGPANFEFVDQLVRGYAAATCLPKYHSALFFAWEEEHFENSIVRGAIEEVSDSTALVVIGYSFPFFNREIDRKIIENMTQLKRVYFQSPEADNIKERFYAFRNDMTGIELMSRFDTSQFLLPNEL